MYALTLALTHTLSIEWIFSNAADFERASTAARTARASAPVVDVGDLQALMDATLAPFDEWPSNGDIEFRMYNPQASDTAVAA